MAAKCADAILQARKQLTNLPGIGADPEGYLAFICDLLARERFDVLLPIHEQGLIFARSHARVIFKPVYGGAYTRDLSPAHLAPPRLERALQLAPITLQAYIPGTNIRSYVLGNAVYAAEIRSASLDFREDCKAVVLPVALPADVQEQCLAIARTLFLTWTAIDWRLTPWGDYVFLEANPGPMFLHCERQTGFPITQDLVHLLMQ